ncbi:TRAP transporter substrate-binding protein [Chelativorans alearense]|uniref:TRAP transporter substrate-binding protein n=1 Tax=Chelativorans alearense TaxID=2681495 RepID=UPI0013D77390|nr:TRAP transporter substrate-binding protein [Chelativorans alearense]
MTIQAKAIAFAAGFVAIATSAVAQEIRWDMATEYGEKTMLGQTQKVFSEKVEELSGGEISITNHFGGSIGYGSLEQFDAVGDGLLPIASTSIGQVAGIEPIFLLPSLPFLAADTDASHTLWEVARPAYAAAFERNNQVLLFGVPFTPAGIWAKMPVTSLEDLDNLTVRAWDASGTRTLKEAGANAVQLGWSDVVPQLASGGIEAVLTSADGGASANFWEFLDDFTAINYSQSVNMIHVNRDEWEALTDEQRDWILAAAEYAETTGWEQLRTRIDELYTEMEGHGMTITKEISPEFAAELREAGEVVYADWLKTVGAEGQEVLDAYAKAAAE